MVNTVGFGLLEATRKRGSILTPAGAANAWLLGLMLWSTLGGWGWGTCVLYLVAGSAVTKLKMGKKEVGHVVWAYDCEAAFRGNRQDTSAGSLKMRPGLSKSSCVSLYIRGGCFYQGVIKRLTVPFRLPMSQLGPPLCYPRYSRIRAVYGYR